MHLGFSHDSQAKKVILEYYLPNDERENERLGASLVQGSAAELGR